MPTITRTTTTVTKTTTRLPPVHREGPARGWLKTLGWILVALGILGLIGPIVDVTHDYNIHLESGAAVLHWVLAIACLVAAYAIRDRLWVAASACAAGAILVVAGLIGFSQGPVGGWHTGNADDIVHLLLGLVSALLGVVSINREREAGRRTETVARTV